VTSAMTSLVRHPVALPVGLALLAVSLLGVVGSVAVHEDNNTVQRDAQTRLRSNRDAAVRALVDQTDEFKDAVATGSVNAAAIGSLRAPTPASLDQVQQHLSTLARGQDAPAAFVSDLRGRIVASYPVEPELIGKDFSFRDWFRGVSRTGRPYVSSAFSSAMKGHPLVVGVAAPVIDRSRRVGYVTILWPLDSVRAVAEGFRRDEGVTITVTDQRGQPLTGTLKADDRGQPRQVAPSWTTTQALGGRSVSIVSGGTIEAAGPVPGIGWTVTASLPSSVALAPARTFQRSLEITLGVALLLVLLATLLAGRLARRRAVERAALRDSEERLRLLVDGTYDYAIFMLDPDGRIVTWNLGAQRMKGYTQTEAVGQHFSIFYTHQQRAARDPDVNLQLAGTNGRHEAEAWQVREDGSRFWANVILTALRDEQGGLRGFSEVTRDLTERQKTEAKFEGLLEAAPDAMIGVDRSGVIRFVNRQSESLFGYARDDLLGQPIETLVTELVMPGPPRPPRRLSRQPTDPGHGIGSRAARAATGRHPVSGDHQLVLHRNRRWPDDDCSGPGHYGNPAG
jgi:PAS domain S-box-containing protein